MIGAGVIGLTTAIRLAEAGRSVRVMAKDLPAATTSAVAAAIWYPYLVQPIDRVVGWSGRSLEVFRGLAGDPSSGVMLRDGVELFRATAPEPWWASMFPDLRHRSALPTGYVDGLAFRTPVIEMPVYLDWLTARAAELGVSIELTPELSRLPSDSGLVVNCTGLGAGRLVGDCAVRPVRGQVVLVRQVGIEEWLLDESSMTYVVPRSHDVVVGGTEQAGEWGLVPDTSAATAILERAAALVPELALAEVVGHRVGLRPARPEVRLEAERLPNGAPVVHCYGHGGAGVTVSWGCAEEVVSLADQLG